MTNLDFEGLARRLLSEIRDLVPRWLPGGKLNGKEYECGSLRGEPGQSLKVNIDSGKWCDFATGEKGGDMISLFAAINGIGQGDAYKELCEDWGRPVVRRPESKPTEPPPPEPEDPYEIGIPPENVAAPEFQTKYGHPTMGYNYMSRDGELLFWVCRYDPPGHDELGKPFRKQFIPWCWSKKQRRWVNKSWPAPRPLYGLELLNERPNAPIMLVEGEKAAYRVRPLAEKNYIVMSWPNGGNSWDKTDWSPIFGRQILIWPDSDRPGINVANKIAQMLVEHCPVVKVLKVDPEGKGWDAADAVEEGKSWAEIIEWAKPLAEVIKKSKPKKKPAKSDTSDRTSFEGSSESSPPDMEVPPIEAYGEPPPDSLPVSKPQKRPKKRKSQSVDSYAQVINNTQINLTAAGGDDSVESPPSIIGLHDSCGIVKMGNGAPVDSADNCLRVLEGLNNFSGAIWYDEFQQKFYTTLGFTGGYPGFVFDGERREFDLDADTNDLMIVFQRTFGFPKISKDKVFSAVTSFGRLHRRNEAKEWLESLEWDGQGRLEFFFSTHCGTEENEYTYAVSKNWWLSMVARIYQPGCKVDNMVILEGGQGVFKGELIKTVASERWYGVAPAQISDKDFLQTLGGKLIIEIAELESFNKADANLIKKLITTATDRYRPPYGRVAQDWPRQSIFVGTTNDFHYLKDTTGNRRFWPIRTRGKADLKGVKRDRDQLFAEAVHRFKAGESWWEMPEALTEAMQEDRRSIDVWEEIFEGYLYGKEEVTIKEMAVDALKMDMARIDPGSDKRIQKVLRSCGWCPGPRRRLYGKLQRPWVPINSPLADQKALPFDTDVYAAAEGNA